MLEILLNFIMQVILSIVNFIFTPFMNLIFSLFPTVGEYFEHIAAFFYQAFTYISTILQWFLFTPNMFVLLFDYFLIKYTIQITIIAIKFAINLYNKFKP